MSRGYTKPYGRKVGNVCATSIQFDKLFKENSNRPSAAKSAGTIGKWGITSFTSIRSTNIIGAGIGGRKEYTVGKKRGRTDSQNSRLSSDSFSFDNDSDSGASNVVKPKKFFKSRNAEPVPISNEAKAKSSIASYGGGYNPRKIDKLDKPLRQSRSGSSSKKVAAQPQDSPPRRAFPTAAARKSVSSPEPSTDYSASADKPPIVLRIFKGTSQLVTPVTTPTTPPIDLLGEGTEISVQSRTDTSVHLHIEHRAPGSSPESARTDSSVNSRSRGRGSGSENEAVNVNPRPQRVKRLRVKEPSIDLVEPPVPSAPSVSTRASRYTRRLAAMENMEESGEPATGAGSLPPPPAAPTMRTTRAASRASAPLINPAFAPDSYPVENTPMQQEAETLYPVSVPEQMETSDTEGAAPAVELPHEVSSPLASPILDDPADQGDESEYSSGEEESNVGETVTAAAPAPAPAPTGAIDAAVAPAEHAAVPLALVQSHSPQSPGTQAASPAALPQVASPTSEEQRITPSPQPPQLQQPPRSPLSPQSPQPRQPADLAMEPEAAVAPLSQVVQQDWSSESETEVDPLERELSAITEGRLSEAAANVRAPERMEPALSVRERASRRDAPLFGGRSNKSCFGSDGLSGSSTEDAASSSAPSNPPAQTQARKKGSIFKSRALQSADEGKKRLALYKHKWSDDKEGASAGGSQPGAAGLNRLQDGDPSSQPSGSAYNMEEEFGPERLTRVTSWPAANADLIDEPEAITSIKCHKNAKGYYTVVRNVKKAHQIQESGEFQEFNDDVEYILDALQEQNPIGTRCLSAITLASKCMAPAFRMHVRAHGTVAKFFKALHDATKDQSLGLCTATVMFVLSQDRLNMDLDRDSLELMLNLLECDASHKHALEDCGLSSAQLHKNKQKVRELCAEIQSQGHAKHLNLDNITVGHLAMETLLSLTSKRAGEWFKEELRELGGLEHIIKTICQCCSQVDDYVVEWTDPLLDRLRKVDRCLRVLENVTHQNEENQLYLLRHEHGALIDVMIRMFRLCCNEVPLYPVLDPTDKESTGVVIREALLANLKVLINLTHDFKGQSYGSRLVGERHGTMETCLLLLLHTPNYVTEEKRFDVIVLALTLLINLVEHSEPNRALLINTKAPAVSESVFACNETGAVETLISMFYRQEESARNEEAKTDAILDGKETKDEEESKPAQQQPAKTQEEFIEETVSKLLTKAGRHMEHTFVAAYIGLLVGYIIMDNKQREELVRSHIPDHSFKTMVSVLQKFFNFMNLTATAVGSSRGLAATEKVIKYMAKIDLEAEMEDNKSEVDTEAGMQSDCDALDESISS